MVSINQAGNILRTLRSLAGKGQPGKVKVSYATDYAVYVHEDMEANHPNGGQAKYLEQPAREMRADLMEGVKEDIRRGLNLEQALLRAGLKLQAASQKLVPVDTGTLRASASTEIVK